jgi:anti-anti-sigma factor
LIINDKVKNLSLDFADVTFIDSTGMGMLLLLRDECQLHNAVLSIQSPQGQVQKIFAISKFDRLFSIH